jgi:hypothetical protein
LTPDTDESTALREALEQHLGQCSYCREALREYRRATGLIRAELAVHPNPEELYDFASRHAERTLAGEMMLRVERHLLVCELCRAHVDALPAVDEVLDGYVYEPAASPSSASGARAVPPEIAALLERLSRERERVGFVPLSLEEYIFGLIKAADVPAVPLMSWLDAGEVPRGGGEATRAFARLAAAVGVSLRQTLAHVRLGFLQQFDLATIPLLLARGRSGGGRANQLEECEALIAQLSSRCAMSELEKLKLFESAARRAYGV